ncbi:unnamed protein product, partial [marine sediment metagenome]
FEKAIIHCAKFEIEADKKLGITRSMEYYTNRVAPKTVEAIGIAIQEKEIIKRLVDRDKEWNIAIRSQAREIFLKIKRIESAWATPNFWRELNKIEQEYCGGK